MADADTPHRKRVLAERQHIGIDHGAMAKKAALDLAAQKQLNSERLARTAKDVSAAKALARALEERNTFKTNEGLEASQQTLEMAKQALAKEIANYKTKKLIDQTESRASFLKSKVALLKHYPNGIPQDLINQLTVLYSDVIKLPEEKDEWTAFIKENNDSIAHFTNVEAARVKNLITAAQMSVVTISSLFDAIISDNDELTVIGIDPNNPKTEQKGKAIPPDLYKELLNRHHFLQTSINKAKKEAGELIGKFVAKTTGPISIENSALLNPFNELSALVSRYKIRNSNQDSFFSKIEVDISNTRKAFNIINDNVGKQKIRGVENPIWGANSWYIITDSGNPANRPFYFNQKTGDTSWKMPNVISLNPLEEKIPTIPIVGPVYQEFLKKLPPFNSVEGLPPIIYTGTRDIAEDAVVPNNVIPAGMTREDLGLANTEKDEHFKKVAKLEEEVQEAETSVAKDKIDVKERPPITAASVIGSPQFIEMVGMLNTPDNKGVIPPPNAEALNKLVTFLSGDPYGASIVSGLNGITQWIKEFNDYKADKDLPADPTQKANLIREKANRANDAINLLKEKIEETYNNIPAARKAELEKQLREIKPVAKIAPQSMDRNMATIASNDAPAGFSTDTEATPSSEKMATSSVSASTSSSATPTSATTQSVPMQGASEEVGESKHSVDEETGEKIQYPSWENFSAKKINKMIDDSFKTNLPDTPMSEGEAQTIIKNSKGKPDMVSDESKSATMELLSDPPIALKADEKIAKANASTEVPTPLKSIPAPEPASAIKIQNDMDSEDEEDEDIATDAVKKPVVLAATKKQSSK
jgi:hypothetical protein